MIIDPPEDILFHIGKFVNSKWFGSPRERVVKYRVRWQGYKPAEDTWQSKEETGWPASGPVLQAYRDFHDAYPRKVADPQVMEAIAFNEGRVSYTFSLEQVYTRVCPPKRFTGWFTVESGF